MNWLSEETLHMIRKKRCAFKLAKRSQKDKDFRKCRDISNIVRDLTRKDHKEHLEEITKDLACDQRPFWRWLKNMRGHHSAIPDLHHAGKVLSSGTEKAQVFSEYFSSVFTHEDTSCLGSLEEELGASRSEARIEEVVLTENEVYEELCRIDPTKASGPDEIPGRLLREGAPWIAEPLLNIFNASLKSGRLPRDWTRVNITPVFKKGDKHAPKNYRPVSLTSLVIKVMERLIQRRLVKFLNDNDKLNQCQHGFRQAHSCQTQLLETIH